MGSVLVPDQKKLWVRSEVRESEEILGGVGSLGIHKFRKPQGLQQGLCLELLLQSIFLPLEEETSFQRDQHTASFYQGNLYL